MDRRSPSESDFASNGLQMQAGFQELNQITTDGHLSPEYQSTIDENKRFRAENRKSAISKSYLAHGLQNNQSKSNIPKISKYQEPVKRMKLAPMNDKASFEKEYNKRMK